MPITIAILLALGTSTVGQAGPSQSCVDAQLRDRLKSGKDLRTKISDEYFNDIHVNSTKTCFEMKKGNTYQVSNERVAQGIKVIEIRDPKSDLYQWLPLYRLDRIGKQVKIKNEYFRDIHQDSFSPCFTMARGNEYQISDAHVAQGIYMVKIRDTLSDIYQWMPSYRLDIQDAEITKACPTGGGAPALKPGGGTGTSI